MVSFRPLAAILLGAACAFSLVSCAGVQDPEATREQLTEVTGEPADPGASEKYDAETNPEPIVDPIDCTEDLIITVRGTGEPKKRQLLSPVARAIEEARADAAGSDLPYPADTDVNDGSTIGVRMLIDTLNQQAELCPMQRFVLLGYSQGALVVGDALSSPEHRLVGATVGEVGTAAANRIRAIVLYGDPRFVGSEPYNAGFFSPSINGLLPRPIDALSKYDERIRDFCVADDFICQNRLEMDQEGHVAYFENGMQDQGAAFAIEKLGPPLPVFEPTDDADSDAGS